VAILTLRPNGDDGLERNFMCLFLCSN